MKKRKKQRGISVLSGFINNRQIFLRKRSPEKKPDQEKIIKENQKIIESLKLEIQNNMNLNYLKNIIFKFFESDLSVSFIFYNLL